MNEKILLTVTIPGSLTQKDLYRDRQLFLKFRYENVIIKKHKPDPALVQTSHLSNEIKKRIPKARETLPLRYLFFLFVLLPVSRSMCNSTFEQP
jgi:hypothetical protein